MPLGDGTGPPDGSGPMTGRKRLAEVCPGVERTSRSSSLLAVIIGVAALVVLAVIGLWRRKKTT